MNLTGLEVKYFRSIRDTPIELKPLKKCNILVGQNNAGKSNIIYILEYICTKIKSGGDHPYNLEGLDRDDRYRGKNQGGHPGFWFRLHFKEEYFTLHEEITESGAKVSIGEEEVNFVSKLPAEKHGAIADVFNNKPDIVVLWENRLVDPKFNLNETLRYKLHEVTNLISKILSQTVTLTIKDDIYVEENGESLPLHRYGMGLRQLVMMITRILSIENPNTIICLEEPETNLHPTYQRRFLEFLLEQPHTFLIATHSSTFINKQMLAQEFQDEIQLFYTRLHERETHCTPILDNTTTLAALNDLGNKASDILQSNCVIWVEGPSDAIFVNKWISLLADDLKKGVHYSIMFYGGSSISHIGINREKPDNEALAKLIELLPINQHAIVIMDSDRDTLESKNYETKLRVCAECKKAGGFCWITDGREIENYIPNRVINAAMKENEQTFLISDFAKIEDVLGIESKNYVKVKYANLFASHFTKDDIRNDLKIRLDDLISYIRKWNE
jgi:predicted ATP-dependent endonuclease of OLD family